MHLVSNPLIGTYHTTTSDNFYSQLLKESEVFGLTIFGDGAKMLQTSFTNMLKVGVHDEAGLIRIAYCSGCIAKGFKKDSENISKLFIPRMERLDPGVSGKLCFGGKSCGHALK